MIDKIEEKILCMLLNDAKTSLTQIAKECKISVPSINSRINQLKKKGIINGSIMQINPQRLGYGCCGVLQIQTSFDKEKAVKQYLVDKKFIIYENKLLSKALFGVFFVLPHINRLAKMIDQLKSYHNIKDVNPIIWNDTNKIDFPENLVLDNAKICFENSTKKTNSATSIKHLTNFELLPQNNPFIFSKIDLRIAKILAENARMPFSKIAKQLGISPNNVISRYKRLKKENVISNSSITINLKKLGYNAMAVLFLKASSASNASMLYNQIIKKPNVIVAIKLLGSFDVMIDIPVRSFSEVFELKEKLSKIQGIENIITELHDSFEKWPLNIFAPILKNNKLFIK